MRVFFLINMLYYIIVMSKNIKVVNINENPEITELNPITESVEEPQVDPPPPTETPEADAPDDIDTDELETMLKDLKQIKKQNKVPPKKRIRKAKAAEPVEVEPEPIVVVVEPVPEPEVVQTKPKRKYTRKVVVEKPEAIPEPETPRNETVEPVRRTAGVMIEEMQRAERALRYQMRKNKMQTLVSQAF